MIALSNHLIIIASLLIVGFASAQSYQYDNSFGTNGKSYIPNLNCLNPVEVVFTENKYYIVTNFGIQALHFDGTPYSDFGENGFASLLVGNTAFKASGCKIDAQSIYIFGYIGDNNTGIDVFVAKFNLVNGVPDDTFGTDGVLILDFGENELPTDLLLTTNASGLSENLFLLGSKYVHDVSYTTILIKILPTGNLDFNFDPTGYKTYYFNSGTHGGKIFNYENGLLLTGTTDIAVLSTLGFALRTDLNGVAINEFGNAGIKTFQNAGSNGRVRSARILGNELYAHTTGNAFTTQYAAVTKFNLVTDETTITSDLLNTSNDDIPTLSGYISLFPDGTVLLSGRDVHNGPASNGNRLRRLNANMTFDSSFNGTGTFFASLQDQPIGGSTHIKATYIHPDGKIFIAALANAPTNCGTVLAVARIKPSPLATETFAKTKTYIAPNPANDYITLLNTEKDFEKLQLIDLSGKIIMEQHFEQQIDVSRLEAGVYFINLTKANGMSFTLKFIKN